MQVRGRAGGWRWKSGRRCMWCATPPRPCRLDVRPRLGPRAATASSTLRANAVLAVKYLDIVNFLLQAHHLPWSLSVRGRLIFTSSRRAV
eukprot:1610981-Pleurochrysis_carterae.AAC.1